MTSTRQHFDEMYVRRALIKACADAGGDDRFAAGRKLHPDCLALMKRGDLLIPDRVLRTLGFMRVTRYVREDRRS
jgi:hypothetical protein